MKVKTLNDAYYIGAINLFLSPYSDLKKKGDIFYSSQFLENGITIAAALSPYYYIKREVEYYTVSGFSMSIFKDGKEVTEMTYKTNIPYELCYHLEDPEKYFRDRIEIISAIKPQPIELIKTYLKRHRNLSREDQKIISDEMLVLENWTNEQKQTCDDNSLILQLKAKIDQVS